MFVQYSFVEKHHYSGFKNEPVHLGPWQVVIAGLAVMGATIALYVTL